MVNIAYNHYRHTGEDLAAACRRGAADLRREAADALTNGDPSRHARKLAAAQFADTYAESILSGTADLDQAQVVALAANMSGILIDPRMPDKPQTPLAQALHGATYEAERQYTATRKQELHNAAAAGLLSRVADPGQIPFYALPGYEPDGYDPHTQTTSLRDRHRGNSAETTSAADHTNDNTAPPEDFVTTSNHSNDDTHNDRTESFAADTVTVDAIEFGRPGPAGPVGPTPGTGRARGDDYSRSDHGSRTVVIGNLNAANASYADNTPVGTGTGSAVAGASVAYHGDEHGWTAEVSHPDGRIEQHTSRDGDEDIA